MAAIRGLLALVGCLLLLGCGESNLESADKAPDGGGQAETLPTTESGLYAAARSAEQDGKPREAAKIYRKILDDFPDSPASYKAEFLIGFLYSEELDQPDSARVVFEHVIERYPDCEFADDAEAMLRFLDGELPEFEDAPVP